MSNDVDEWLERESRRVEQVRVRLVQAKIALKEEKRVRSIDEMTLKHALMARDLIVKTARIVQQQAHQRIASVVTSCLQAVFQEEAYKFGIEFQEQRGRTGAILYLERDGIKLDKPMDAAGGGVVDVAAFALRAACLVLHRPRLRRLLVLDEPFKFVSREYRPRIRQMLEQLSQDLSIQIIMVTHDGEYQTGTIIRIT